MQRKIIWMRYLLLGSLICIVAASCKCIERTDALFISDWLYVNNSSHTIQITSENWEPLLLQPGGEHSYDEQHGLMEAGHILKPEDYATPYWWGCTITIDETTEYSFDKGEGIAIAKNYESHKVRTNYYKFTYVFTDELIDSW